jgi:hypothetical protein
MKGVTMYVLSRRLCLSGFKIREAMALAVQARDYIALATGLPLYLWTSIHSPQVGTLLYTTAAPDLATLEAAIDKLNEDDGYFDLLDKASAYVIPGSVHERLGTVIHPDDATLAQAMASPGEYLSLTVTTILDGQISKGMALGVEIASGAERATGQPTAFVALQTGNYGSVGWVTQVGNATELDHGMTAIAGSQEFVELIESRAGGVYASAPGGTVSEIFRRIP